ncbi:MAG: cobalamin biosynthesis protein CbiX [Thauera phenolivorans]|uniref:Cobalamin biosynthesis protein CbiX n=1 Tax=Thauera phenolivorans TaxID=1792543 RepID=A0A7X7R7G1_9RHOO|nr:CbiX/SirB N-terminal domain-containing protein [Thauera phenolivorans]NLF53489.1 cobalamin biosynthesis protein CbiX [Thauera phenolivorans]
MNDGKQTAARAVILFGHGARDPAWAGPMRRIREAMLAEDPATPVELAFLELMTPTLAETVDSVVSAGAERIAVVPIFLAQGGHLKRDLPEMLEAVRGAHPGCEISLAPAAGEADGVIAAMAAYARACLD